MNYIKQLQAEKAEALDSARSVEAAINHLISYLSCPKFHVDTRVQVGDVLRDLPPIRNDVTHLAITIYNGGTNDKNSRILLLLFSATCRILSVES